MRLLEHRHEFSLTFSSFVDINGMHDPNVEQQNSLNNLVIRNWPQNFFNHEDLAI